MTWTRGGSRAFWCGRVDSCRVSDGLGGMGACKAGNELFVSKLRSFHLTYGCELHPVAEEEVEG